ncbi:YafY family protein [Actinomyces slackii]|uniref:Proteasome accessory factor C n=1 Tax=Actinomyces slackii TaxID=52774 RepID=A0A3S4SQA6_9ACTO|nr:WYL domain-containing protein [Actinomyces slackii]VEG75257.1 Proteasome accessory factor C [Actinomyces slackii]
MARPSSTERLARLLALPAWVAHNEGATIAEAAGHFGVTPHQIEADVNTLWVSGLPGGLPGDLVDFNAADFEAGYLSLAEPLGLDRPVRLSRQEALSLVLSLRVLAPLLADDAAAAAALVSAERAIAELLVAHGPRVEGERAGEPPDEASGADQARSTRSGEVLAAVRTALAAGRRLELDYVSATDARSQRQVDPIELVSDGAHLALLGWCLSAGARRTFRLDRILSATVLEHPAAPHRASRSQQDDQLPQAILTLRPTGRWLTEQIECLSVEQTPQGTIRAVVEGRDEDWLTGLVLSAGAHLVSVEPASLAERAGQQARLALAAYGEASPHDD